MEGETQEGSRGALGSGMQVANLLFFYLWMMAPSTCVHTQADWCVLPGLSLGPSSIRGILFISFYPIQAESSTRKELGS